jgi:hypothetical protein
LPLLCIARRRRCIIHRTTLAPFLSSSAAAAASHRSRFTRFGAKRLSTKEAMAYVEAGRAKGKVVISLR